MGAGVRRPPARGGVPFARRLQFAHVCPHSRVVCVTVTFAPTALTLAAPTPARYFLTTSSRAYPSHPQPRPALPGCKRLHLTFGPSWVVKSAGRAKSRIVRAVVAYAGRTPAVTGRPDGSSLPRPARWPGWAREFVARQPVAAFRSPVCSRWSRTPLTLAAPLMLAAPHQARLQALASDL